MVDALVAAHKDFDLIMLPNRRHGFVNEPYGTVVQYAPPVHVSGT